VGHRALAVAAIEYFELDRLLVLVAERPGHKLAVLDGPTRLRLADAAFGDLPGAEVRLDGHAFTVDLVAGGAFRGDRFVVGADELAAFLAWREPQRILDEVRLAVGTRPGYPREVLDAALARIGRPDRVELFELPAPVDASSTEIRRRVAAGEAIDGLVPAPVAALIAGLGLYRPQAGLH
jgi:nicotinate-nucleotide adenylyltransferase